MTKQENPPARRLKHRNIVAAAEIPDGESLRKVLDAGPLPIARAIQIAHDIASGLAHAHLEGVVHNKLKSSSILVSPSGVAKITDFGAAQPGQDHRSDVFALGVLLYEMLTRQPPTESPVPPSELNPHVPRALDAIVLSMLARQPADRMPGVPILVRELERLREGLGLAPTASAAADAPTAGAPKQDAPWSALDDEAVHHRKQIIDREVSGHDRLMKDRELWTRRPASSRPSIFAMLALALLVLGVGFGAFMYYSQEGPAAAGATAPAPLPVAEVTREPIKEALPTPAPIERAPEKVVPPVPPPELPKVKQVAAKAPQPQPAVTAKLILAISPGGEVYIDGQHLGTTPQTTTFDLEPGMRRIEIRSGSRRPFLTYMTVEPGEQRRIRHDFDARPSRPPS